MEHMVEVEVLIKTSGVEGFLIRSKTLMGLTAQWKTLEILSHRVTFSFLNIYKLIKIISFWFSGN